MLSLVTRSRVKSTKADHADVTTVVSGTLAFPTIASPDTFTAAMRAGLKTTIAATFSVSEDKVALVITTTARRRRHLLGAGESNGVSVEYTARAESQATADQGKAAMVVVASGGDVAMLSFLQTLKTNTPGGGFASVDTITIAEPVVKSTTQTSSNGDDDPALPDTGSPAGAIAGAVIAVVIIAAVVAIALYNRRRTAAKRARNEGTAATTAASRSNGGATSAVKPHDGDDGEVQMVTMYDNHMRQSRGGRTGSVDIDNLGDDVDGKPKPEPSAARQARLAQLQRSGSRKISAKFLSSIKEGLGLKKYVKAFANKGYTQTSDFKGCTRGELGEMFSEAPFKQLKPPETRK